jgi:hypothetical protein
MIELTTFRRVRSIADAGVDIAGDLLVGQQDLLAPLDDRRESTGAGRVGRVRVDGAGADALHRTVSDERLGLLEQNSPALRPEAAGEDLVRDEPQVHERPESTPDLGRDCRKRLMVSRSPERVGGEAG